MKQTPIDIPCATPEEWLKRHKVTKCTPQPALGISNLEQHFGITVSNSTFRDRHKAQASNEVSAARQKFLTKQNKSTK